MKIKLNIKSDDDPGFIAIIEKIISASVKNHKPDQVFIIYIKNWFDHKWLKFSGKGRVRFDDVSVWQPEIALAEFFRDKLTFPPFTPNRILSQQAWAESSLNRSVHSVEKKHSSWNLQKRVIQFSNDAQFFWYSSGSLKNQRGSLMVYTVKNNDVNAWYVSFIKENLWKVHKTKKTSKEKIDLLIEQKTK